MTPADIEAIYERLPYFVVELDPDPSAKGPKYLQNSISKVRGYLNNTGIYLQRVLKVKADLESDLGGKRVAFQISSDELLAGDKRVTRLPAIRDREAMINLILRAEREETLLLEKRVNDIGYVEKAIRHRHRELEQTMSAIRLQRTLIQTELRTGSFYGDEGEESRGSTWGRQPPKDEDIDEEEIDRLMAEAEASEEEGEEEGEDEASDEPEAEPEDEPEPEAEPEDEPEPYGEDDLLGDLEDLDDDVALGDPDSLLCSVCGSPQKETETGLVCPKGHGEKEPAKKADKEPFVEAKDEPETDPGLDAADLFGETEEVPPEPAKKVAPAKDEPEDPDIASFLDDDEDFSDIFAEMDKDN